MQQLAAEWRDIQQALVAAQNAAAFPVGHASAQQVWRGLRSRPTWRVLAYSAENPPRQRALVLVERGNVMRIVTRDQLAREREAAAKLEEARVRAEETKAKAEAEIRQKAAEALLKEQVAQQMRLAAEAADPANP